ncbi:sporulation-specific protein 22 [Pestalotiopsis sp. IQ-011]
MGFVFSKIFSQLTAQRSRYDQNTAKFADEVILYLPRRYHSFAHKIKKQLPGLKDKDDIRRFTDELEDQTRAMKPHPSNNLQRNNELNSLGIDVWNTCVSLSYDEDLCTGSLARALVHTRVFAFQLLVLGQGTGNNEPGDLSRLAKIALKTGKACIAADEFHFAQLALQKAADCNKTLQTLQRSQTGDEQAVSKKLEADYYILRIALSWKEDRLDVAEHMYSKFESIRQNLDPAAAEDLSDILFEVGSDLFRKKDFDMAVKWLTTADEIINSQELERLSREAIELRLSISQTLIQAHLEQKTAESLQQAENHVAAMESDMGDKLVVLLLRLDILQKTPSEVFNENAYANILRRMIRTVNLSDSTFKLIVSHIRELDDKSPSLALQTLDLFLLDKVLSSEKSGWIESALILRVMFSTSRRDSTELVGGLRAIFDRAFEILQKPVAADVAIALLTQSGDKLCTLKALRLLADKYDFQRDQDIHFPALLRSIIRVQVSLLGPDEKTDIDPLIIIDDICRTFEAVVILLEQVPRRTDGSKLFIVEELNWFSKNSYNLGIKNSPSWKPQHVLQMCNACVSIMKHYPDDLPADETADVLLRRVFCHFMISMAHVACARSEDNIETQLQQYLGSRKHTELFELRLAEMIESDDDQCRQDLQLKLCTLLVFDFEACVNLKAWDALGPISRKLGASENTKALQAVADMLLRAQPPTQVVYSTLRIIVNETFQLEKFETEKLAKYMRCLLRTTISDTELALKVIEEVCTMTKQASKTAKPFPDDEMHWFATTAYERSIAYNQSREDGLCRKWMNHALSLAHYYRDGGVLEKTIQDNYTKLHWGPA